jgi:hypothetical protein
MHPIRIELTEHVCLRYIERFDPNLSKVSNINDRLNRAKIGINSILRSAHYVSDNDDGILLHSPMHKCNLIVRKCVLITLWKPDGKKRSQKESPDASPDSIGGRGEGVGKWR